MIHKCTPSSMNKYYCTAVRYCVDAQELLFITQHKTFCTHPYTVLLTLPDRNVPLIKANAAYQKCLPSCELHSHDSRSLTSSAGITALTFIDTEFACKLRDHVIAHMVIMQSLDWLCNPKTGMQFQDAESTMRS